MVVRHARETLVPLVPTLLHPVVAKPLNLHEVSDVEDVGYSEDVQYVEDIFPPNQFPLIYLRQLAVRMVIALAVQLNTMDHSFINTQL